MYCECGGGPTQREACASDSQTVVMIGSEIQSTANSSEESRKRTVACNWGGYGGFGQKE